MPHDAKNHSTLKAPTPIVTLTPEKQAFPAAGGSLDCLFELSVALPDASVDRHPIDLALVIDRSGSMSGEPLMAAKAAAREAVSMLLPGDRVAVVAFDDQVRVALPLTGVAAGTHHIDAAIDSIAAGGSTNLFGGWVEGMSQVINAVTPERVARVALLSDGHANHGVTQADLIAIDVAEAARLGVTTSVFGFGRHYDEALLRAVADAGGGNYIFIEDVSQTVDAFQQELASVSALRGRNVRLAVVGTGVGIRLPHNEVGRGAAQRAQASIALPPMIGGLPFDSLVTLEFQPGAELKGLVVSWDDVLSSRREELFSAQALQSVSAAAFATLPSNDRVVAMRRALDIAALKRRAAEAAERNDAPAAHAVLRQIAAAVATLPAGTTRDEETAELERMTHHVNDMAMFAKRAHYAVRNRLESSAPEKMSALKDSEMRLMRERKARYAEAATRSGATTPRTPSKIVKPAPPSANIPTTVLQARSVTAADGRQVTVQAVTGNIVSEQVDALVNSTNRAMFGTGGVDGAIHKAGGKELTAAVRSIGRLEHGTAVFTPGFELGARYVIHVASRPSRYGDAELLRCYSAVFDLADRLGVTSIAVPLIGAGFNSVPVQVAERAQEAALAAWLAKSHGPCRLVRCVGLAPRLQPLTLGEEAATGSATALN